HDAAKIVARMHLGIRSPELLRDRAQHNRYATGQQARPECTARHLALGAYSRPISWALHSGAVHLLVIEAMADASRPEIYQNARVALTPDLSHFARSP